MTKLKNVKVMQVRITEKHMQDKRCTWTYRARIKEKMVWGRVEKPHHL